MGKINVLSFAVANLIAAGEVVDRPSSVIKELLENAIDSGADNITVEIQNGGVTYMRVADNGCGISPEDLPVAIRRHATSKIKDASDLEAIMTLGFRGEALAAIASVSDMRIISRTADAENGSMLTSSAGNILGVTERPCAQGTTVIVENLFANVPARRKFLKKDITESMAVSAMVEKIALSKPNIAFKLIVDGNVKLQTYGDGQLKNAIYSVFGRDFASKLISATIELDGIRVEGFIGRPDNVRANRNYQNFFINGRYVKTKTALAAIEQAYTSYIAPDKYPCCVLFITISPNTVDVNVHPAKLEVKFSNEKPVFEAIYYAVRNALESDTQRPDMNLSYRAIAPSATTKGATMAAPQRVSDMQVPVREGKEQSLKARQIETSMPLMPKAAEEKHDAPKAQAFAHISAQEYLSQYASKPESKTAPAPQPRIEEVVKVASPKVVTPTVPERTAEKPVIPKTLDYRIVGEVFNSYVIVERGDVMLLIDKHAAHERILFEKLKAGMKNSGERASQLLMLPLEIMMTGDEILTLLEYKSEIEALGFDFTAGKYTANVTAIPEGIGAEAVSDMLQVMADRLKNAMGTARLTRDIVFEKALYQASCKAAIKAGREYPPEYVEWVVSKLMELPDITVCPHGRPVAMEISRGKINHQFERN